jgi:dienelactone hydrolase
MKPKTLWLAIIHLLCGTILFAQSTPPQVTTILDQHLDKSEIVSYQLQKYLIANAPPLPKPTSADAWTAQANAIRHRLLDDVIFRGWPKQWVDSAPKFEDLGQVSSGKGYRRRKLRYEVVPGVWSAAILYEPENLKGSAPAILNVTGHVGPEGKSIEYEQKRCINFALQGIIALELDWLGHGELSAEHNQHWYEGHLDLVGANAEGLVYLEMRRGLDYLYGLPTVDHNRIGMTGLSGGGWQTMFLGALDERVNVTVPVAGYDALAEWLPRMPAVAGDNEQGGTDVFRDQDYATLTAVRAPKPTMITLNAEDDCCFRAAIVRPYVYDAIKPFFNLYGKSGNLQFHENTDPSTHNYQLDNRIAAYKFFTQHFDMPVVDHEIPVDDQIKSYKELEVGLPQDNLTILSLAARFASEFRRTPIPTDDVAKASWAQSKRSRLKDIVRYQPVTVSHAWALSATKSKGVESIGYRFEMSDNLPATGVWMKGIATPADAPITIVLNDKGKTFSTDDVQNRVNRGEQILALDVLFTGDASMADLPNLWAYPEMLSAAGQRPLGMEAAQVLSVAHWLKARSAAKRVRVESRGMRMQAVALVASALEPDFFNEQVVHDGIPSLGYLLSKPVHYEEAADLFCLGLYQEFDLNEIAALGAPSTTAYESSAEPANK